MSQLKEILATEQDCGSLEKCAIVHLFREGTFYRAYEWSAWLCVRCFTELKVTHRLLKGGEDIILWVSRYRDYLIRVSRIPTGCKRLVLYVLPNVNPSGFVGRDGKASHRDARSVKPKPRVNPHPVGMYHNFRNMNHLMA